jgi:hypothetical protein
VLRQAASTELLLIQGHEMAWMKRRSRWVCLLCSESCADRRLQQLNGQACRESLAAACSAFQSATSFGHVPWFVWVAGTRAQVICCLKCGCYAEAGAIGLAKACPRIGPSKGARYRLGRFLNGLHPTKALSLDGPYRELPSEAVWRVPSTVFAGWTPSEGNSLDPPAPQVVRLVQAWQEGEEFFPDPDPWPEGPPDWTG